MHSLRRPRQSSAEAEVQWVGVVRRRHRPRVEAERPRPRRSVGGDERAGRGAAAVDAVGISCERPDARLAAERDGEAEEELDAAPAASVTASVTVVSPSDACTPPWERRAASINP